LSLVRASLAPSINTTQYFCKNQNKLEKRFQKTTVHWENGKKIPVCFVFFQKYCVLPIDGANDAF
jgi:hypothetical protein